MQNSRLAIIVPYRDRAQHLMKFKPYMQARFKDAKIVIVEQADNLPFNRGKLLNIGALNTDADYFALHDVDMLPIKSDYSRPEMPTLLATRVQQFGYKMPFPEYFGGVVLINKKHFFQCNGYHNNFWGWGGEDNDLRERVLAVGLEIHHRDCTYNSLHHDRKINFSLHKKNVDLWKAGPDLDNGLTTCNYKIISKENNHIKVEL